MFHKYSISSCSNDKRLLWVYTTDRCNLLTRVFSLFVQWYCCNCKITLGICFCFVRCHSQVGLHNSFSFRCTQRIRVPSSSRRKRFAANNWKFVLSQSCMTFYFQVMCLSSSDSTKSIPLRATYSNSKKTISFVLPRVRSLLSAVNLISFKNDTVSVSK